MNDFAARLEEASSALQKLNYQPLEEFPALAVQVARRTALAMIQEMLGHLRSEFRKQKLWPPCHSPWLLSRMSLSIAIISRPPT